MQIDPLSLEHIYPELRRLARRQRRQAGRPTAFETTELIHEAWMRLGDGADWADRGHYLATAARAMRSNSTRSVHPAPVEGRAKRSIGG